MIFKWIQDRQCKEPELTLRYAERTAAIEQLATRIQSLDVSFPCRYEEQHVMVSIHDIYYFEAVEKKTFVCMKEAVYECDPRLYELEQVHAAAGLVRISKSIVVNIHKVQHVRPTLNGRFIATLKNNEEVVINRHYVPAFKKMLGIG